MSGPDPGAPVVDDVKMAAAIARRTGIDIDTVTRVLDAELEELIALGIAGPPEDASFAGPPEDASFAGNKRRPGLLERFFGRS